MTSFLRQVAAFYSQEPALQDHCFVFPNRRSGQFFEKELSELFTTPHIMPRVVTMAEWLEEMNDLYLATTVDSLFTLYRAYTEAFGPAASSFDKFIYWAHIILSDFNDIDMALADVAGLYSNLNDLREIATDYIDPELKTEIQRIFNIEFTDSESFWKNSHHETDDPDSPSAQFYTLWEKLPEIYERFYKLLNERGLTTQGHLYRTMAGRIAQMTASELGYKQMVMVGFTALSVSEDHIFKALKQLGCAHFWWDDAAPAFDLPSNKGGQMVRMFSQRYPAPEPLETIDPQHRQHIHAMAVGSAVGEAKWAFHLIDQMGLAPARRSANVQQLDLPKIDVHNAINTAIVLPDENLFVPLINSVPPGIDCLNVTLGYPMRHSGITTLMHIVARAHRQATHDKTNNRWMFFRDDVKDVLSHPVVKSAFTADVVRIGNLIERSHDFNVPHDTFAGTALEPLFTTIASTGSKADVLAYIDRLLAFLQSLDAKVRQRTAAATVGDALSTDNGDDRLPLQSAFIVKYAEALEQLRQAINESDHLPADDSSIFHLVDRITAGVTVPFTGEPLQGLQIMGLLEARCLDFDNIILLSANERVLPSSKPMSSFIPDFLRAAHLMPTNAWHEAVTTGHFYRLLSRASHVSLIYDSSSQNYSSAEPTRYIAQLKMIYHRQVHHHIVDTKPDTQPELAIEVPKRQDMLAHYTQTGAQPPLSASAIKKYLRCQLLFYLRYVQHLSDDNTASDFIDAATFGSIVHNTLQQFYYPKDCTSPRIITRPMIEDFIREIPATITSEVNRTYFHKPEAEAGQPLHGDAYILSDTIASYVSAALNHDLKLIDRYGSIEVIECEVPHVVDLDVGGLKVNFTFTIDRLDRVGDTVRLIDYKTGKNDDTHFANVGDLLSASSHKKHALMQLLLYCNALHQMDGSYTTIEPMIYKLGDINQSGMMLKPPRGTATQYRFTPDEPLNQQFLTALHDVLKEMLATDGTFTQTSVKETCNYCRFAEICRR